MPAWRLLPILGLFSGLMFFCNEAHARRGIPIIYGNGADISDLGALPTSVAADVESKMGPGIHIGYKYSLFHIYFLNVWTWNGEYVLFRDQNFWTLEDADWRDLLGDSVAKKYGAPWGYRIPPGAALLVGVVVCIAIGAWYPTHERQLQKAADDPRYAAALNKAFGENLNPRYDPLRFDDAVRTLVGQNIAEAKARRNLTGLAALVNQQRQFNIEQGLALAKQMLEQDQLNEARTVLQDLCNGLPPENSIASEAAEMLARLPPSEPEPSEAEPGATTESV